MTRPRAPEEAMGAGQRIDRALEVAVATVGDLVDTKRG